MRKEYIKIASIPDDEKIVAMTQYGGFFYWNWSYPFRHYKKPRYVVATEKAVYQIDVEHEAA